VYLIETTAKFERSLKKLRANKDAILKSCLKEIVGNLTENPRINNSWQEPLPPKVILAERWEFRKLKFKIPDRKGASGQYRLMYLVSDDPPIIRLLWLYTHEEYRKRSPDDQLRSTIHDATE
jgi:mRNA-degrading endonuclease RelE of RelBE toxin-antitoxin system